MQSQCEADAEQAPAAGAAPSRYAPPSLLRPIATLAFFSLACAGGPACTSDLDCSLNGVCDTGTGACACDAPWVSGLDGVTGVSALPYCSFLDFRPSPVSPCGPACVFHGGPSSLDTNWTSWGMSVVEVGGTFHGFVAEMANECGLGAWTKGSQVVHATSATPTGPFTRGPAGNDIVVPAWSHNPAVIKAPDGAYVIFTLGDGWPQNGRPDNCTASDSAGTALLAGGVESALAYPFAREAAPTGKGPLGRYGNCSVMDPAPNSCDPNPCWTCRVTVHTAAAPDAPGPWVPVPVVINYLSNYDNLLNWNPSPLVLPNGSVAVMIHTDDNQGWSGESIAVADSWRGPFNVTVPNESVANEPLSQEDPFYWVDHRGHHHCLVHKMFDPAGQGPCGWWAGGHLFSPDGTKWSPISRAYNVTIVTADGAATNLTRRERPKLIFNAAGAPTHLFNGMISGDGKQVYTGVAPLNV